MPKRKPWDHLFARPNSPCFWVRFTVHEHGAPLKVRRSTDEALVYVEAGGKRIGGTKRRVDPEAHAQALARAEAIYHEETHRPSRDPSEASATVRTTILDAYRGWAGTEHHPGKLVELARQRDPQFLRRQTYNMRYVVPPQDANASARKVAIRQARNARLSKMGRLPVSLNSLMWKPPWTFVDEITKGTWEQVRADLHRSSKVGFLKAASIRSLAWTVRAFLEYCCERGWIAAVPVIEPPSPALVKKDQSQFRAFTEAERDQFRTYLRERPEHRAAYGHYTLMLLQGLRKSTVERMRRNWINFPAGVMTIPAADYKDTKRDVHIALHKPCIAAIKDALKDREDISGDALVFGPFDHEELFWRIVRELKFADIERLTAHHIGRRTSATILAEHGATESELMAAHGWSTPEIAHQYIKGKLKLSQLANSKMPLPEEDAL